MIRTPSAACMAAYSSARRAARVLSTTRLTAHATTCIRPSVSRIASGGPGMVAGIASDRRSHYRCDDPEDRHRPSGNGADSQEHDSRREQRQGRGRHNQAQSQRGGPHW